MGKGEFIYGLASLAGMILGISICINHDLRGGAIQKTPSARVELIRGGIRFIDNEGREFDDLGLDGVLDKVRYKTPGGREVTVERGSQEFEEFISSYERLRQELSKDRNN